MRCVCVYVVCVPCVGGLCCCFVVRLFMLCDVASALLARVRFVSFLLFCACPCCVCSLLLLFVLLL